VPFLELQDQHLFDKLTAADLTGVRQLIQRIDGFSIQFQLDAFEPTTFIAVKLIALIDAQLFITRKRIGFRSSRATLIREQI